MRNLSVAAGGFALGLVLAASWGGSASAAAVLGWSFSATGVGSCDKVGGCDPINHPPVYTKQTYQFGDNMNAASSAADATWGLSHGSANPGSGPLILPELHSDVTGGVHGFPYSWNYSQVQGVIGFTAANAFTLDLRDFVGTVDYTNGGTGTGLASVSLAILDSTAGSDPAIGDSWFPGDGQYGFANDCNSPAALAIGETGYNFAKGNISATLTPTICGSPTIDLAAGDTVYFWARMMTFVAGNEFVDASHTFHVTLAPDVSPETVTFLSENLTPTTFNVGAPEPATWAMLVFGFGAMGGLLRSQRRRVLAT